MRTLCRFTPLYIDIQVVTSQTALVHALTHALVMLAHAQAQADLEHVLSEIAGMRVVLPDRTS